MRADSDEGPLRANIVSVPANMPTSLMRAFHAWIEARMGEPVMVVPHSVQVLGLVRVSPGQAAELAKRMIASDDDVESQ